MIRRLFSFEVRSTSATCRVQDFPTTVQTGVCASSSARRFSSSSGRLPARQVAPKAASLAVRQRNSLAFDEELQILGVRPRPAAFDVRHSELVQFLGDPDFIFAGKGNSLALGSVAQGRIVDFDHFPPRLSARFALPLAGFDRREATQQILQFVHSAQQAGFGKRIDREGGFLAAGQQQPLVFQIDR